MHSVLQVGTHRTTRSPAASVAAGPANRRLESILLGVGVVLAAAYAVQLWTPLRLNQDAIVLLSVASSAARGAGMTFHGQPTHYPPGYPLMVMGLDRLGLVGSPALVLLNLFSLAIGVACAFRVLRRQLTLPPALAAAVCACTLLSFVVIKHSTLPISDLPYFGFSLLALACLDGSTSAEGHRRVMISVVAAFLAAVLAIAIRTIGIALLPAIGWKLWRDTSAGRRLGRVVREHRRLSATLVLLAAIGAGLLAPRVLYIQEAAQVYRSEAGPPIVVQADYLSSEMGELLANVPEAKLPARSRPVLLGFGIVALALLGAGFWVRKREFAPADVYLAGYCAILAVWPYRGARFWLPVVPLLFAYFMVAMLAIVPARPARVACAGYFAWAMLTGAAGLAYSTALSLSGSRFADRYGDGNLRGTYRYVLGDSVAAEDVNPDALAVLLEFTRLGAGARAQRTAGRTAARAVRASR